MPSKSKPKKASRFSSIRRLKQDPKNARRHTERNQATIDASIKAVGLARSIVVDEGMTILADNATAESAIRAGKQKLLIVDADGDTLVAVRRKGLTPAQKTQLALADNRAAELAEWNPDVIREFADAGLTEGFWSADELKALFQAGKVRDGKTAPDDVPPARKTKIKSGHLFQLGTNRLLCGDCTKTADVDRLMDGAKAKLMNTDPPYGISYQNEDLHPDAGPIRTRVKNDGRSDADLQAFLEAAFRTAKASALDQNAAWYLWHAMLTQGFFSAAAAAAEVILHRQIVWVKPVLVFGRGQYHWKHELCFMGWVDKHQPPDYGLGKGERTQTTVWEVDHVTTAERKEFNHSTPKPVGLFTIPIVKHLKPGEACYEPFAGTGPQFIAAEQHGVSCYGLELEPRFCQVIIDRWEAFTGQKAVKL